MKTYATKLSGFLAILILIAVGLACSDAPEGAKENTNAAPPATVAADEDAEKFTLDRVEMRADNDGELSDEVVTSYKRGKGKLHCYIGWLNGKTGTRIKTVWTATDAGGAKDYKLKEIEGKTENEFENYLDGTMTITKPLPRGKYKVDVYVNDKLERTVPFSIE